MFQGLVIAVFNVRTCGIWFRPTILALIEPPVRFVGLLLELVEVICEDFGGWPASTHFRGGAHNVTGYVVTQLVYARDMLNIHFRLLY